MTQNRRSIRYSQSQQSVSKLKFFESLVGFNPYIIEDEAERCFKDILHRMLQDFAKSMQEHQMGYQMTNFRLEDHFNDAIASIEDEMNKFSRWIENNIVDKNYIQQAKVQLNESKNRKKQKLRKVFSLTAKLSETIRDKRVDELSKILEKQMEKYRIKDIKNTYEYDRNRSIQQKYQKQYNEHFLRTQQKFEKICSKYQAKYNQYA